MPRLKKFSLEHEAFPQLVNDGLYGFPVAGKFIDIGTPQRFQSAQRKFRLKSYGR
jgi:NDP-sugar pyrophosphorylase family protein